MENGNGDEEGDGERDEVVVVNAADNPAHHLQQQLQRELLVADQHTNAILKNHPKPVGNI